MQIEEWYEKHDANHAHCKHGCDHPQPFVIEEDAYCGRCWFVDNIKEKVFPCNSNDECIV